MTENGQPKCPARGSTDCGLMPPDFETLKCQACGKNSQATQESGTQTVANLIPDQSKTLAHASDEPAEALPAPPSIVREASESSIEIRQEDGLWRVYVDAELFAEYSSESEAMADAAELQAECGTEAQEASTSSGLEERPFRIDGVSLTGAQIKRLSNLCAGTGRGAGSPMSLVEAVDLWRRQNHSLTLKNGRQVWAVHSASPTYTRQLKTTSLPIQEGPVSREHWRVTCLLQETQDPSGHVWNVVPIREGWSNNGKFYTRQALEEALPLFEKAGVNVYGYRPGDIGGHVPRRIRESYGGASGLVLDKVGWLDGIHGRLAEDGRYEVAATFHCVDDVIAKRLVEALKHGNDEFLGFSIDGNGDFFPGTAEGRRGYIVGRITELLEVTLVTNPAAGGRFERLVAGIIMEEEHEMKTKLGSFLRGRLPKAMSPAIEKMEEKALVESTVTLIEDRLSQKPFKRAKLQEGLSDVTYLKIVRQQMDSTPEVAAQLLDAFIQAEAAEDQPEPNQLDESKDGKEDKVEPQAAGVYAPGMMESVQKQLAEATAEIKRNTEETTRKLALMESQMLLKSKLAESGLPQPAKDFLQETFGDDVLTAAQIDAAIGKQRTVLAESHPTRPQLSGQNRDVKVTNDYYDKLRRRADLICGYQPKDEERALYEAVRQQPGLCPSVRELYLEISGDRNFTGNVEQGFLQEATTADFPNLLGTSMTKALVPFYQAYPNPFEPLVSINPNVSNFMTQDRVQIWGFGRLPVVAEGGQYPDGGIPREEHSSYQVSKRGLTATITIEMIANDNLGALQNLPREQAIAAKNEEAYFFGNLLIGNVGGGGINSDETYDGVAVYHANHRNLSADALSHASLLAARTALRKQFRRGSSTTCSADFSDVATSVSVASTAGFKAGDYFQIDAEIVRIAAITNLTTLDVTGGRAQFGTTAVSHLGTSTHTRLYQVTQPVPLSKVYVVVPDDLESQLDIILRTEKVPNSANWDVNIFQAAFSKGTIEPIVASVMHLGDTNNWYQVADPKTRPGIEVAYLNNRREPEILLADMPTVGAMFTNDQLIYKVRHIYGGVVVDPFGLYASIVA